MNISYIWCFITKLDSWTGAATQPPQAFNWVDYVQTQRGEMKDLYEIISSNLTTHHTSKSFQIASKPDSQLNLSSAGAVEEDCRRYPVVIG